MVKEEQPLRLTIDGVENGYTVTIQESTGEYDYVNKVYVFEDYTEVVEFIGNLLK